MRPEPNIRVEQFRKNHPTLGPSDAGCNWGYFEVPFNSNTLRVLSSGAEHESQEWEHVSISLINRCPNWQEMCMIKNLFWDEQETAIQFHPKKSEYVNTHPNVLHLWKCVNQQIKLPPKELIG